MQCSECGANTPEGIKQKEQSPFDILHYPESIKNVSVHLNENGHSVDNFSFTPIDKVENEWPRLLIETYWMHRLKPFHQMEWTLRYCTRFLKLNILFMSLCAYIPTIDIGAWWWLGFVCVSYWPVHPRILIGVFAGHIFFKLWAISYPLSVWWELWSECADAWADIGLHWVNVTIVGVDVLRLILQSIFCTENVYIKNCLSLF